MTAEGPAQRPRWAMTAAATSRFVKLWQLAVAIDADAFAYPSSREKLLDAELAWTVVHDAALEAGMTDRDWSVRLAAERAKYIAGNNAPGLHPRYRAPLDVFEGALRVRLMQEALGEELGVAEDGMRADIGRMMWAESPGGGVRSPGRSTGRRR